MARTPKSGALAGLLGDYGSDSDNDDEGPSVPAIAADTVKHGHEPSEYH